MGYLPIPTSRADRIFISVVLFIGIHFLWMRFLEKHLSLFVATAIGIVLALVIIKWG
ncbi:MAG: hypothetical protein KAI09_04175 [Dehalococcoidales bacterium]|nr:hypothetical protein [Dehalococcoidales bacterium]